MQSRQTIAIQQVRFGRMYSVVVGKHSTHCLCRSSNVDDIKTTSSRKKIFAATLNMDLKQSSFTGDGLHKYRVSML